MFWRKKPTQEVEIARALVHRYQAGDLLLVNSKSPLSSEQARRIKGSLASLLPGAQIAVLSGGLELEVIRPEGEPEDDSNILGVRER
jgi:hypothetical protein